MNASARPEAPAPYVGRFAPSPTGPLHFGSLLAATGSYLRARQADGRWLLRIEDIDPPREIPGASDAILRCLEAYGFEWDGPVIYQSDRLDRYADALVQLRPQLYRCTCSRAQVARDARRLGLPPNVYPGTCRDRHRDVSLPGVWRMRFDECPTFDDVLQGPTDRDLASGDFIVWRRAGWPAYQLAVAFDDGAQGVTEVVRGIDLLDSTPRQIHVLTHLGHTPPAYCHLPVVVASHGDKLSKQTGAQALDERRTGDLLCRALRLLGAAPPAELSQESSADIWRWGIRHWAPNALKNIKSVPSPAGVL